MICGGMFACFIYFQVTLGCLFSLMKSDGASCCLFLTRVERKKGGASQTRRDLCPLRSFRSDADNLAFVRMWINVPIFFCTGRALHQVRGQGSGVGRDGFAPSLQKDETVALPPPPADKQGCHTSDGLWDPDPEPDPGVPGVGRRTRNGNGVSETPVAVATSPPRADVQNLILPLLLFLPLSERLKIDISRHAWKCRVLTR